MASSTTETVRVADCSVNVMRGGKGPPLLFLHGAGGAGVWLPFMAALSERYEVIVPDHPGFGRSDTPDWLDQLSDLAYFYLDFIEALGLDQVHLVGHSLGGWIAAEIAVRSTRRLRTLTLVGAAGVHVNGVAEGRHIRLVAGGARPQSVRRSALCRTAACPAHHGGAGRYRDQERAQDRGPRLAAAVPRPATAQMAAPDRRADADRMGRRRQDFSRSPTARPITA